MKFWFHFHGLPLHCALSVCSRISVFILHPSSFTPALRQAQRRRTCPCLSRPQRLPFIDRHRLGRAHMLRRQQLAQWDGRGWHLVASLHPDLRAASPPAPDEGLYLCPVRG